MSRMKPSKTFLPALLIVALGAGCAGTGPNTQQGAVAGAGLGALAGAIIGNNSGGHNALGGAAIGAVVGGIAGGTVGNNLDHQRGTIYTSEADATTKVVVQEPPPPPAPPAEVVVVRPGPSAVWIAGYWAYAGDGRRYDWIPGHWEVPPPRYQAYVAPHWAHRGGNYVYIQGYWR
jgi:outer membrane lipoprotein SlyB